VVHIFQRLYKKSLTGSIRSEALTLAVIHLSAVNLDIKPHAQVLRYASLQLL